MKKSVYLAAVVFSLVLFSSSIFAQQGNGQGPRRLNADPNATPLLTNWVDLDGDGICDNFGTENQGAGQNANAQGRRMGGQKGGNASGQGLFNGFGDGTGVRPLDGTGFGRGNGSGSGVCDGTGTGSGTGTATGTCDSTGPKGKRGGRG